VEIASGGVTDALVSASETDPAKQPGVGFRFRIEEIRDLIDPATGSHHTRDRDCGLPKQGSKPCGLPQALERLEGLHRLGSGRI